MILYDSIGPNPRVVRMFAAEKGVELPSQSIDIVAGENRDADYLAVNPAGTTPALRLDDGPVISETVAICEYLDEAGGGSSLIGTDKVMRAITRMWVRRVDLLVAAPMTLGFRAAEGRAMFEPRMKVASAAAAADLKAIAAEGLVWIERQLGADSWLCGDRFSLADIVLFSFIEFGSQVGQPLPAGCDNLRGWLERTAARPSAAA